MTGDPSELNAAEDRPSESTDEDSLGTDPLEDGVDPPEHWSGVDKPGTTYREQREGESLEEKLAEERID
jgi:hypothetical protein